MYFPLVFSREAAEQPPLKSFQKLSSSTKSFQREAPWMKEIKKCCRKDGTKAYSELEQGRHLTELYTIVSELSIVKGLRSNARKVSTRKNTYTIDFVSHKHLNAVLISGVELNFFCPQIRQVCECFSSRYIIH